MEGLCISSNLKKNCLKVRSVLGFGKQFVLFRFSVSQSRCPGGGVCSHMEVMEMQDSFSF